MILTLCFSFYDIEYRFTHGVIEISRYVNVMAWQELTQSLSHNPCYRRFPISARDTNSLWGNMLLLHDMPAHIKLSNYLVSE
jgi:hypothetical protein